MSNNKEKNRIKRILSKLGKEYPDVKSQLNFKSPFQLLIATILSAQCTDARVNLVTKDLFKKLKNPKDFVNASSSEIEKAIFSTGFYKQKTKSIKGCCAQLVDDYKGKVPKDFDELTKLPGVGRKTASVVAGNAFGIPAIAVDTHVIRITNLLGFVSTKDPVKIEMKLKEIVPQKDWVNFTHWFISHGRKVCIARRPNCLDCIISSDCPSKNI